MTYEIFKDLIFDRLTKEIPDPKTISIRKVNKNNGITLDGLTIMEGNSNISPTIYLDYFYEYYQKGLTFQEVYEQIMEAYVVNRTSANIDIDFFTDFERVKSRIMLKLINYDKNKTLLASVPHIQVLDLAIVFFCMINMDADIGCGSILIHQSHLKDWQITTEELFRLALANSQKKMKPQLHNMLSLLSGMDEFTSLFSDMDTPIYVLTNEYKLFGASCILYKGLIQSVAEKCDSNLYILPCSIHEVILIPSDPLDRLDAYSEIVQEVNYSVLEQEDYLSNHAYYYLLDSNELCSPVHNSYPLS